MKTNDLPDNSIAMLRGKTSYTRIASIIEGKELESRNQRARQNNRPVIEKPHTTITIKNAVVEFANPQQPTLTEQYFYEKLNDPKNPGHFHTAVNKTKNLPKVGQRQPDGKTITEVPLPADLAQDLDVTIILRVYPTNMNKGISLDSVIVNEPIRYYERNSAAQAMESRGLVWQPASPTARAEAENTAKALSNRTSEEEFTEYDGALPFSQEPVSHPDPGTDYYTSTPNVAGGYTGSYGGPAGAGTGAGAYAGPTGTGAYGAPAGGYAEPYGAPSGAGANMPYGQTSASYMNQPESPVAPTGAYGGPVGTGAGAGVYGGPAGAGTGAGAGAYTTYGQAPTNTQNSAFQQQPQQRQQTQGAGVSYDPTKDRNY